MHNKFELWYNYEKSLNLTLRGIHQTLYVLFESELCATVHIEELKYFLFFFNANSLLSFRSKDCDETIVYIGTYEQLSRSFEGTFRG